MEELCSLFYNLNKDILVCTESSKHGTWYTYESGIWQCIKEKVVKKMIYTHMPEDTDLKQLLIILREAFYIQNFINELDSNPYILCFGKDLYDLKIHSWRETLPTDMCSLTCGVGRSSVNNDNTELLMVLLSSIFKDLQHNINIFSTYLCGKNDNKIYRWVDGSFLKNLFLSTFGDYCIKINPDKLYKLKGVRIGFIENSLNDGTIKSLVAGEEILCMNNHHLYVFNAHMKIITSKHYDTQSMMMRTETTYFKKLDNKYINRIKGSFMYLLINTYKNL